MGRCSHSETGLLSVQLTALSPPQGESQLLTPHATISGAFAAALSLQSPDSIAVRAVAAAGVAAAIVAALSCMGLLQPQPVCFIPPQL